MNFQCTFWIICPKLELWYFIRRKFNLTHILESKHKICFNFNGKPSSKLSSQQSTDRPLRRISINDRKSDLSTDSKWTDSYVPIEQHSRGFNNCCSWPTLPTAVVWIVSYSHVKQDVVQWLLSCEKLSRSISQCLVEPLLAAITWSNCFLFDYHWRNVGPLFCITFLHLLHLKVVDIHLCTTLLRSQFSVLISLDFDWAITTFWLFSFFVISIIFSRYFIFIIWELLVSSWQPFQTSHLFSLLSLYFLNV